jgi:hypothetical protein
VCTAFGGLFFASCSKTNDISGAWKGKITLSETGKSLSDLEIILTQKGKDVSGTMIFTKPMEKLPLSGTVDGGKISLTSPLKKGLSVAINGTLERRGKITGEALLNYDLPQLGKRQDKTQLELTR